jgi:hypothetical protein
VPYANPRDWTYWPSEKRKELPQPWPPQRERRRASDGTEYSLSVRALDMDPLAQSMRAEIRAQQWRDDELIEEQQYPIDLMLYFKDELVLMLERAGFREIEVRGAYDGGEPTPEHGFLVFSGTK